MTLNSASDNAKCYVVETNYVGPNLTQGQYVDVDTIEIRTAPAITNGSCVECVDGWCGTYNDWAIYAHGEYATVDEARTAIADKFGAVRECDSNGQIFQPKDENTIETYRRGRYELMSRYDTVDWAYAGIKADIEADTTDERIAELISEYEHEANSHGLTLHSALADFMKERRQELRDELEEEV